MPPTVASRKHAINRGIYRYSRNNIRGIVRVIEKLLKAAHLHVHLVFLYLNLHHYIITDVCFIVQSNIYIKKTISEKNHISIFL